MVINFIKARKKPLIIYLIILAITLVTVFSPLAFGSMLTFLNWICPLLALILPVMAGIRLFVKYNPWSVREIGIVSDILVVVLGIGLTGFIFFAYLFLFTPNHITTITASEFQNGSVNSDLTGDRIRLTFVDNSMLMGTNIRIFKDYYLFRIDTGEKLNTDDAFNPFQPINALNPGEKESYKILWYPDSIEIRYPVFYSDEPEEKWTKTVIDR